MSEARQETPPATPAAEQPSPPVPEPTGPGTAVAAQEQLRATEKPPGTILTEQQPPAEEAPAKAGEKPAEPPPPAFDAEKITFPEGFVKNDDLFGKFTEIAKAEGLSLPGAQKVIDLYATAAKVLADNQRTAWNTTLSGWETEVRGDPVIAKETLRTSQGVLTGVDAVVARVGRLLDNPMTHPGARAALEVTGLGSHPAWVHTLNNYAKAFEEGSLVEGNGPAPNAGRQPSTRPDAAGALYPNNPRGGVA